MKKYRVTTAKNAVKNGLVKEGDEIWVKAEIIGIKEFIIDAITEEAALILCKKTKIRIPIPEPKPIDFGEAGRVLKSGGDIICTTGYLEYNSFAAYVLESENYKKGWAFDGWAMDVNWQDITDTYKP